MQLLGRSEALPVKHGGDLGREHAAHAIALLPGGAKAIGILAPAVEAGAMPCRKGSGFIEKEQLGPALPLHHLAPAATEIEHAGEPSVGRPALLQELFRGGAVDDAAVADKHSAIRNRDNLASREHAGLK